MSISLENWLRNKLQENEDMHDYAVATETVRVWIDEWRQINPKNGCDLKSANFRFIGEFCDCAVGKCREIENKISTQNEHQLSEIDESDEGILRRFMQEFFPFRNFKKIGFFTKEMKGDYEAQAKRVCEFFGFETVYEYRATEMSGHISYAEGHIPENEPHGIFEII